MPISQTSKGTAGQPSVGIVLVNYNGYADTAACLDSLRLVTYPHTRVVVTHNGCADDSTERLNAEYPDVHHINSDKNLGFCKANNLGIDWLFANDTDHILLLNNDTIVTPGFLEPLIARLLSDPKIGAVTGKIYYAPEAMNGRSDILWYAGCFQKWHTGFHHTGVLEVDTGKYDVAQQVPYSSGCAILMRGELVHKYGGLSEDYFLYWEEADWCHRVGAHGYISFYEPKSIIYHNFKSALDGKETPLYMYLQTRNAFIFAGKHYHGLTKLRFAFLYPIYLSYRFLYELKHKNIRGAKSLFLGVVDALRGRKGIEGMKARGFVVV
jgi:GT2 family glycosyltransferase